MHPLKCNAQMSVDCSLLLHKVRGIGVGRIRGSGR